MQVARLRGRKVESGNGGGGGESRFLSEAEARDRIASQGSVGWKVSRLEARRVALGEGAGEVLWNDASREDLERAVAGVVGRWKRASPAWWGLLLWGFPPLAIVVAGWWLLRGWWVRRACLRREFLQNEREKEEGKGI